LPVIRIKEIGDGRFSVVLEQDGTTTCHVVTVDDDYHRRLTRGKIAKDDMVRKSIRFLLLRESRDEILPEFDLRLISHQFPSYEGDMSA
jgi:hypothetical protein